MSRICTLCGRKSIDGNFWCQEFNCPAEDMPSVFRYGQYLGDAKILRLMKVLRTATFYEAERAGGSVLLKVAHRGRESQLRREAQILQQLQGSSNKALDTTLPHLLPAYQESTVGQHSYGKAIIAGESVYYEVFEYVKGEFLRDILLKNPQPWYEKVAWLTISLAETIAYLNTNVGRLHLGLSPEVIFVRTDVEDIYRPVLMDLGLMINETHPEHLEWLHHFALPAYTAPELTYTSPDGIENCLPATTASDVYGLGILLYEMLNGHPTYEYRLSRENQVREAVRTHKPPSLTRRDLPDEIHIVIEQALSKAPHERYLDVPSFAKELRKYFGSAPREKKRRPGNQRLLIGATLGAVVLAVLVLLGIFLS